MKFRILLTLIVCLFSVNCTLSQTMPKNEIQEIKMTLSVEKNIWAKNEQAIVVKLSIENLSENTATLPAGVTYKLSDGTTTNAMTMRNEVFWSPVSFSKNYDNQSQTCQNDLKKEQIKGGSIYPSSETINLKSGEKKEYSFNLVGMCWNHVMSSVYPNKSIFSLAKSGKFILYSEISFSNGSIEMSGMKIPLSKSIKSNEIDVEIK
jgi:hypothetical protein